MAKQLVASVLIHAYSWSVQLCNLLADTWDSLHHLLLCQVCSTPENYLFSAGTHGKVGEHRPE